MQIDSVDNRDHDNNRDRSRGHDRDRDRGRDRDRRDNSQHLESRSNFHSSPRKKSKRTGSSLRSRGRGLGTGLGNAGNTNGNSNSQALSINSDDSPPTPPPPPVGGGARSYGRVGSSPPPGGRIRDRNRDRERDRRHRDRDIDRERERDRERNRDWDMERDRDRNRDRDRDIDQGGHHFSVPKYDPRSPMTNVRLISSTQALESFYAEVSNRPDVTMDTPMVLVRLHSVYPALQQPLDTISVAFANLSAVIDVSRIDLKRLDHLLLMVPMLVIADASVPALAMGTSGKHAANIYDVSLGREIMDGKSRMPIHQTARTLGVRIAYSEGLPFSPPRHSHDATWRAVARAAMDVRAVFFALRARLGNEVARWRVISSDVVQDMSRRMNVQAGSADVLSSSMRGTGHGTGLPSVWGVKPYRVLAFDPETSDPFSLAIVQHDHGDADINDPEALGIVDTRTAVRDQQENVKAMLDSLPTPWQTLLSPGDLADLVDVQIDLGRPAFAHLRSGKRVSLSGGDVVSPAVLHAALSAVRRGLAPARRRGGGRRGGHFLPNGGNGDRPMRGAPSMTMPGSGNANEAATAAAVLDENDGETFLMNDDMNGESEGNDKSEENNPFAENSEDDMLAGGEGMSAARGAAGDRAEEDGEEGQGDAMMDMEKNDNDLGNGMPHGDDDRGGNDLCNGFDEDNRGGIPGTLHRVSVIHGRAGTPVGATLRVGRHVHNAAGVLHDILHGVSFLGASILVVGAPGSGKTTMVRDAARMLAENHRVMIVDSSDEIGGPGDVPHACVGHARRMSVAGGKRGLADALLEAVENHTPDIVVADELRDRAEVAGVVTARQRGVRVLASAHGSLRALIRNPVLRSLVGGMDRVTLGDAACAGNAQNKIRHVRAYDAVFDVVVEMGPWPDAPPFAVRIVPHVQEAVDNIMAGNPHWAEMRWRGHDDNILSVDVCI